MCIYSTYNTFSDEEGDREEEEGEGEGGEGRGGEEDFELPQVVSYGGMEGGSLQAHGGGGEREDEEERGLLEGGGEGRSRSNSEGSSLYGELCSLSSFHLSCSSICPFTFSPFVPPLLSSSRSTPPPSLPPSLSSLPLFLPPSAAENMMREATATPSEVRVPPSSSSQGQTSKNPRDGTMVTGSTPEALQDQGSETEMVNYSSCEDEPGIIPIYRAVILLKEYRLMGVQCILKIEGEA